jgi:hypothetical protein
MIQPLTVERKFYDKRFRWTSYSCEALERLKALDDDLSGNQLVAQVIRRVDLNIRAQLTGELLQQYLAGQLPREALDQALAETRKSPTEPQTGAAI